MVAGCMHVCAHEDRLRVDPKGKPYLVRRLWFAGSVLFGIH